MITLTWRWRGGVLYDVTIHADGSITFRSVPDLRTP